MTQFASIETQSRSTCRDDDHVSCSGNLRFFALPFGTMNAYLTWRQVGARIAARRAELKLTQSQLAERAGISQRSVQDLENGAERTYTKRTLSRLELALYWTPGSIDAIRADGEPTETEPTNAIQGRVTPLDVLVPMPHDTFAGLTPEQVERAIEAGRRAAADVAAAFRMAIEEASQRAREFRE